jgi:hypothetical protein
MDSDRDETYQSRAEHIHIRGQPYEARESSTLPAHAYDLDAKGPGHGTDWHRQPDNEVSVTHPT